MTSQPAADLTPAGWVMPPGPVPKQIDAIGALARLFSPAFLLVGQLSFKHKPHYSDVTMSAKWLFAQPFVQAQIKENINAMRHWPLCHHIDESMLAVF